LQAAAGTATYAHSSTPRTAKAQGCWQRRGGRYDRLIGTVAHGALPERAETALQIRLG